MMTGSDWAEHWASGEVEGHEPNEDDYRGSWVNSPRQEVQDLLDMLDVSPAASLEVFYVDAG